MSTSAIQFSKADVDIRTTKKRTKITKQISTFKTQFSEADANI